MQDIQGRNGHLYPQTLNPRQSLVYFTSSQIRFSLPGILYKWDHTVYTILCLASSAWHNGFESHPCCCVYQEFITGQYSLYDLNHSLLIHSPVHGHCFQLGAIFDTIAMNVLVQEWIYPGIYLGVGLPGRRLDTGLLFLFSILGKFLNIFFRGGSEVFCSGLLL